MVGQTGATRELARRHGGRTKINISGVAEVFFVRLIGHYLELGIIGASNNDKMLEIGTQ